MKKRIMTLLTICIIGAMALTACSASNSKAKETAEPTTAAEESGAVSTETQSAEKESAVETVTETETETESVSEAAEGETASDKQIISEEYDPYLAWTDAEWTAASDADKRNAAIAYTIYTSVRMNIGTTENMIEAMQTPGIEEQLKTVIDTVDQMITMEEAKGMSILELADLGLEQYQKQQ